MIRIPEKIGLFRELLERRGTVIRESDFDGFVVVRTSRIKLNSADHLWKIVGVEPYIVKLRNIYNGFVFVFHPATDAKSFNEGWRGWKELLFDVELGGSGSVGIGSPVLATQRPDAVILLPVPHVVRKGGINILFFVRPLLGLPLLLSPPMVIFLRRTEAHNYLPISGFLFRRLTFIPERLSLVTRPFGPTLILSPVFGSLTVLVTFPVFLLKRPTR